MAAVLAGVVVVAALGLGAAAAFRPDEDPGAVATPTVEPTVPTIRAVPTPEDLTGAVTGEGAVFTWTNPDPQDGDRYLWGVVRPGQEATKQPVEEPTVTVVPETADDQVCIEVVVVRADGRFSTSPAVACAEELAG